MTKALFVAMHRPIRSPSQRFRFEQYLEYLNNNGVETHFSYLIDEKQDKILYKSGHFLEKLAIFLFSLYKRWSDIRTLSEYEFVYIQREAFMTASIFFEKKV